MWFFFSQWPPLDILRHWFEPGGRAGTSGRMCCPWGWNNVQWAPAQLMGLGLLFIKDRPLYSRNRKSYFCPNKSSAPIAAVIGKLSHFGIYREVFMGRAGWWESFICFHFALVWDSVSSLNPFPWHPSLGLSFLSRESSFGFPFSPQVTGMVQGVWEQPGWLCGGYDSSSSTELGCCREIKRSFSNKCNYTNMLEPCVLFNSSPRKEAFLRALLLSESKRYPSASGILSGSWVAINIGLQSPLKIYPSRTQGILCQAGIL